MIPAAFWERQGEHVVCTLCPHACRLADGERGRCGIRTAGGGGLRTAADGRVVVAEATPIERKPLYHVTPGSLAYSFAAAGCNLACRYCQNWLVSQTPKGRGESLPTRQLEPAELVAEAVAAGCPVVAATYSEPTVFLEYAAGVAAAARDAGLRNVWKTNGFIQPAAQQVIAPLLDAVNVDLKAFREATYQELLGGSLGPVLDALRGYRAAGVWVEVTTLIVPTVNDSPAELAAMAAFLREELGPDTPWHLTRFHPAYALRHLPVTPRATLHQARAVAREAGLRYVYTNAETGGEGWHTACAGCGATVIERAHDALVANHLRDGCCPACGTPVPGVGLAGRAGRPAAELDPTPAS